MFEAKTDAFEPRFARLAEMSQALSHPARIAILRILAERGTCICGDLVDELPLSQASVSRHLKTLKEVGLIRGEVDGPRSCYCLDAEAVASFREGMTALLEDLAAVCSPGDCC